MIPMHYFSSYTLDRFLSRARQEWEVEVGEVPIDGGVEGDPAGQAESAGAAGPLIRPAIELNRALLDVTTRGVLRHIKLPASLAVYQQRAQLTCGTNNWLVAFCACAFLE